VPFPRLVTFAAGRRQRGGRGLARHRRAQASAGLPRAEPFRRCPLWIAHAMRQRPAWARRRLWSPGRRQAGQGPRSSLMGTGKRIVALRRGPMRRWRREGIAAAVVSMPFMGTVRGAGRGLSRNSVLPTDVTATRLGRGCIAHRLGIATSGGDGAKGIAMNGFWRVGASPRICFKKFGFTPDKVVAARKANSWQSRGRAREPV